jgi:hypothetical protein
MFMTGCLGHAGVTTLRVLRPTDLTPPPPRQQRHCRRRLIGLDADVHAAAPTETSRWDVAARQRSTPPIVAQLSPWCVKSLFLRQQQRSAAHEAKNYRNQRWASRHNEERHSEPEKEYIERPPLYWPETRCDNL